MSEYFINDLLCFISSSSETKTQQAILNDCVSYYNEDQIREAKEVIHNCLNIKPKWRRSAEKNRDDCKDIIEIICNYAPSNDKLPTFVTNNHKAFPPSFGYELLQNSVANMCEQITSLKEEINTLKEIAKREQDLNNNITVIKEEIIEIKSNILQNPLSFSNQTEKHDERSPSVTLSPLYHPCAG